MKLTTLTTFGGVGSAAAAVQLSTYGDLGAAAALAVVSVILLGTTLYGYGILPEPSDRVRSGTRRVATVAGALLIVSAVAIVPLSGGASALLIPTCLDTDNTLGDFLAGFSDKGGNCAVPDYENMTRSDQYASALAREDANERFNTSMFAWSDNTRAAAWTDAKLKIVERLNAGDTATNAKADAKDEVENYYADKQLRVINQYESSVAVAEYINSTEHRDKLMNGVNSNAHPIVGFVEVEVVLANGSTTWVDTEVHENSVNGDFEAKFPFDYAGNLRGHENVPNTTAIIVADNNFVAMAYHNVTNPPTSLETEAANLTRYSGFAQQFDEWGDQSSQITTNVDAYVDDVYATYNESELDTTDLLSASDLASRAATDYNSTGYYAFASAEIAMLGLEGNLNRSLTVESNGSTYTGELFYTADDLSSIDNGTTYDPTTLNGETYMAASTSNGSKIVHFTENWTVTGIVDPTTGDELTTTTTETYTTETTNASQLQAELDALAEAREEYETATSAAGSGSGGNWFDDSTTTAAVIGIAGAALLIFGGGRSS